MFKKIPVLTVRRVSLLSAFITLREIEGGSVAALVELNRWKRGECRVGDRYGEILPPLKEVALPFNFPKGF